MLVLCSCSTKKNTAGSRFWHAFNTRYNVYYNGVTHYNEQIKLTEGRKGVLSGVPRGLESLIKAYRLQEKAAGVGFDWDNAEQTWAKVEEEIAELRQETAKEDNKERISEEFGDLLFAMINYARKLDINPSHALEQTNKKFIRRFEYIEQHAEQEGKTLPQMSLDEMEALWQQAKHQPKDQK